MGNRFDLPVLLRRLSRRDASASGPHRPIDVDLVIEAARLVVTTRLATRLLIMRKLDVTAHVADQLLHRLEHCSVVAAHEPGRARRVLTTSAELPGVIAEFRSRG